MKKNKTINQKIEIEQTDNGGFYIKVGCVRIALSTKEELIDAFVDFINNPDKFYKEFGLSVDSDYIFIDIMKPKMEEAFWREYLIFDWCLSEVVNDFHFVPYSVSWKDYLIILLEK